MTVFAIYNYDLTSIDITLKYLYSVLLFEKKKQEIRLRKSRSQCVKYRLILKVIRYFWKKSRKNDQ